VNLSLITRLRNGLEQVFSRTLSGLAKCLSALFLLAGAAMLRAETTYAWTNFVGHPGGPGSADGTGSAAQFCNPSGIAVDGAGNLYVVDSGNNRISKGAPSSTGPIPNIVIECPKGTTRLTGEVRNLGTAVGKKKLSATFTVHNTGTSNLTATAISGRGKADAPGKEFAAVSGGIVAAPDEDSHGGALTGGSRHGTGAAEAEAVDLAGTTWTQPMTTRVNLGGAGEEDAQGTMRLTFDADGSLYLEDGSGVGLWGTWAVDNEGVLSARVFPQGVEDCLRAALGNNAGFGLTVDAADLDIWLTAEPGGPVMHVTLDFTARIAVGDPGARKTVAREMTCEATASGPAD